MDLVDSCLYCGRPFLPGLRVELDHMDPKARGGWDHPDNLVACCKRCNSKKKDRLFFDWLELLTEKRSQLARAVYVEKHCYQPEDFLPLPDVLTDDPDEYGCFWSCDWYHSDEISDEDWWYKERWYAYCEINFSPLNKGDRAIQYPNQ